MNMCADPIVVASGARCLLAGSEKMDLICGDKPFMETSMLMVFLATPKPFQHPLLGKLKADTKHFITVSRTRMHTFWICTYEGEHPPVGPPTVPRSIIAPGNVSVASNKKSRSCFPNNALVRLKNGSYLTMERLEIGHEVYVGGRVLFFTHRRVQGMYEFLRISLDDGRQLRVSEGHHIYIGKGEDSVPARNARIGDKIDSSHVVQIDNIRERGLFNPQTFHGDIVVDDVRISTYTEAVPPTAAHSLLAPLRALYRCIIFGRN